MKRVIVCCVLALGCGVDGSLTELDGALGEAPGAPEAGDAVAEEAPEATPDTHAEFWAAHGELRGDIELVAVPKGDWTMGLDRDDVDWDESHTPHHVTLTRDFWIGETEVTVAQWLEYSDYHPTAVHGSADMAEYELRECSDCPVHTVSWDEILAFANAVSRAHGLEECFVCTGEGVDVQCDLAMDPYDCEGYRMATEAEWEHAAWGGETFTYPGSEDINEIGWWEENSGLEAHPVAQKLPNGYGIYDMGGSIREFVLDWQQRYPAEDVIDPYVGPEAGSYPAERGGSWACRSPELRPNRRNLKWDYARDIHSGFRLARTVHPMEHAGL